MLTLVSQFHGSLDLLSLLHALLALLRMNVQPLVHVTVSMAFCNIQCPFGICGFEVRTSRFKTHFTFDIHATLPNLLFILFLFKHFTGKGTVLNPCNSNTERELTWIKFFARSRLAKVGDT
jgi:hypothetical protein